MAITKEIIIDKMEILENGNIQVRTATKILEDGVLLSKAFSREVLNPGQDISSRSAREIGVANAVWTDEIIAAYAKAHPIKIGDEQADAGPDD